MTKPLFLFLFLLLACFSCDRPECKNTNPIFDKYPPESVEYKRELVHELLKTEPQNVGFWADSYKKIGDREYMYIYVQSDAICAKGILDITEGLNLDNYKRVKGKSYSGAKIQGLQFRFDTAVDRYDLVYVDMTMLVD